MRFRGRSAAALCYGARFHTPRTTEAIEETVVIGNDAERTIAVSRVKNAVSKELGENRFKQLIKKLSEI